LCAVEIAGDPLRRKSCKLHMYVCICAYTELEMRIKKIGRPFLVSSSIIIDYYAYSLEMYGRFCPINSSVGIYSELGVFKLSGHIYINTPME